MAYKIALLLAFATQLAAAVFAMRLNFRYRIYSAWFLVSASAGVAAILRLTTLCETWSDPPTSDTDWVQWGSAFAALMASIMLLGGMSFIEPFFKQLVDAQEALRSEKNELESYVKETEEELRLAQRIQRQLLPAEVPDVPGIDLYGQSDPAEWTSGDYFDYLLLADGCNAVVVADVSGHGLGPALLMSSTRASFRSIAPGVRSVAELLTAGNRAIADAVSDSEFVTAFAASYHAERQELQFAAAGQVAYLLKADGSVQTLAAEDPPLGILPDLEIPLQTVSNVSSGDTLVMVTDGILEMRNTSDEMLGEDAFLRSLQEHTGSNAKALVQTMFDGCRAFAGSEPQHDDITAVVMSVV